MLAIQTLSPIHVGAGQGAGVIDLPVIREATTGWPYLPGSSVKGVLRDTCITAAEWTAEPDVKQTLEATIKIVFGPATTGDPSEHAGGIIVGDQHLLCLAVRSWFGGFAWVTCPFAINRWIRDAKAIGNPIMAGDAELAALSSYPADGAITVNVPTALSGGSDNAVYIEDLKLTVSGIDDPAPYAGAIARFVSPIGDSAFFGERFGIVSDTTFGFLTRTAMDVVARNSIDSTRKIVKNGALWWEESVPAESVFMGPIIVTPQGANRMEQGTAAAGTEAILTFLGGQIDGKTLQIGGNATVGRGLALARLDGYTAPAAPGAAGGDA